MAGRWTELWDEERKKWVKVFIDLPSRTLARGSATTLTTNQPVLYGPDQRPIPAPPKHVGFRKP